MNKATFCISGTRALFETQEFQKLFHEQLYIFLRNVLYVLLNKHVFPQ